MRHSPVVATVETSLPSAGFWVGPRRQLVRRLIRNRLPPGSLVVDAAAGPGSPLADIDGAYRAVVCFSAPRHPWRGPALRAAVGRLPLADASVEGVLLLDVVERVDDDRAIVADAGRALRTGGLVLVTAPAGPHLWSVHDERSGHLRRYTEDGLTGLVATAGLLPEQVHHFQCLLHPVFVASRRWARSRQVTPAWEQRPPALLDRVLTAVNRAEVTAGRRLPWPWGGSLAVVARKP